MTDSIPQIELALGDKLERIVILDDSETVSTIPDLISAVPGLVGADNALEVAEAINHLAVGGDFTVISDPSAFQESYEARLASEDPAQPWQEGVIRLIDFGRPDFSEFSAPQWSGTTLSFFATDSFSGLPYKVEATLAPQAQSISEDNYKAVSLNAVLPDPIPTPPSEMSDDDKAFLEMMSQGVESPSD